MSAAKIVVTRHQQFLDQLLELLSDGEVHRCKDIADQMGVVLRTIYRSLDELRQEGHRVEGSTGKMGGVRLKPINTKRAA